MPIRAYQIGDGQVPKEKIPAGAGIETSKLADGPNFIKKDGSVVMTNNLDLGGFKATNSGTPTTANEVANKGYVDNAINNALQPFTSKGSVRAATTGNINLANPGTAVFDTATVPVGETVLARAQTAASENGLYTFNGPSAAMTRSPLMDVWAEVPGATVTVEEGALYADTMWLSIANRGGTLGTTAINWQQIPTTPGLSLSAFQTVTPGGALDGVNVTFTLPSTPSTNVFFQLFVNGVLLREGIEYTRSGATITLTQAPGSVEWIRCYYIA